MFLFVIDSQDRRESKTDVVCSNFHICNYQINSNEGKFYGRRTKGTVGEKKEINVLLW